MKTAVKAKTTCTAKRELFAELSEGIGALAEARQGKRTLRTHVTSKKLIRVGEGLKRR